MWGVEEAAGPALYGVDLTQGRCRLLASGLPEVPTACAWLGDEHLALGVGGRVWLLDASVPGGAPRVLPSAHARGAWVWELLPLGGRTLASVGTDGRVIVHDRDVGAAIARLDRRGALDHGVRDGALVLLRRRRTPRRLRVWVEAPVEGRILQEHTLPLAAGGGVQSVQAALRPGRAELAVALGLLDGGGRRSQVWGLGGPAPVLWAERAGAGPLPPWTELRWVGPRWLCVTGAGGGLALDTASGTSAPVRAIYDGDGAGGVLLLDGSWGPLGGEPARLPPRWRRVAGGDRGARLAPGGGRLALSQGGRLAVWSGGG